MSETPITVGDPPWAAAITVWHYCRNLGADGIPTPELLANALRPLVAVIQEHAWDDACQEAYDRGHMHDLALDEMRARNPFKPQRRSSP